MQNFKKAMACIFILVGGMGFATALLSLLNPLGAKIHDAGDPLGAPVTTAESSVALCVYAVLLVAGIIMAVSMRRNIEES